jgi:excisionase family DNA binding protein
MSKPELVAPEARLLDVPRAAQYLSTSTWCVRTLAWEKRVPFLRLGKKVLFDRRDLDAYVETLKSAA